MGKPSTYRKSTPVTRLRRNVQKMSRLCDLVVTRLGTWSSSGEVRQAMSTAANLRSLLQVLDEQVLDLETSGFVPPRRSTSFDPEVGQRVRILDKHRSRFEASYPELIKNDPALLDDLLVKVKLPSGEVTLQRGRVFLTARKTHLGPAHLPDQR